MVSGGDLYTYAQKFNSADDGSAAPITSLPIVAECRVMAVLATLVLAEQVEGGVKKNDNQPITIIITTITIILTIIIIVEVQIMHYRPKLILETIMKKT